MNCIETFFTIHMQLKIIYNYLYKLKLIVTLGMNLKPLTICCVLLVISICILYDLHTFIINYTQLI